MSTARRVTLAEDADRDLDEITRWLMREASREVATRFQVRAAEAFARLARMPMLGRPRSVELFHLRGL